MSENWDEGRHVSGCGGIYSHKSIRILVMNLSRQLVPRTFYGALVHRIILQISPSLRDADEKRPKFIHLNLNSMAM
jgi:hypothetical protein